MISSDNDFILPQFPQNLTGSFWGITTFFNPNRYRNKLQNLRRFRQSSRRQGLKLLCVELAFGQEPFELTPDDADILIQRRANSILWQKERLLNIALKNLPADCDKVAWVDADIIFKNNNWIAETCQLLNRYKVVQPFQFLVRLPRGVFEWEKDDPKYKNVPVERFIGKGYKMVNPELRLKENCYGHTGMVWAARRDWLDRLGFYDKMVVGAADSVMAEAFFNKNFPVVYEALAKELAWDIRRWKRNVFLQVQKSVYYTPGTIVHLWHGHKRFRLFDHRLYILGRYGFVPKDLRLNADECWEWATEKKELHRWAAQYFRRRNEEGSWISALGAMVGKFVDFELILIIKAVLRLAKGVLRIPALVGKLCMAVVLMIKVVGRMIVAIFLGIDWMIGQVGLFLRHRAPKVYYFLKGSKKSSS